MATALVPAALCAQVRVIRVVSSDGQPVAFANVTIEGGDTRITDEQGDVSVGSGRHQTLTVRIRRIGFSPWFGKLEFPDTSAVVRIMLPRLAQDLTAVKVTGTEIKSPLEIVGFYDRWLMRQKGLLSATFVGPEELDFRHPDKITNVLYGLNGVRVARDKVGNLYPVSTQIASIGRGLCPMAIVIDGVQQHSVFIDHLVDAVEVAAIEVYPRGGNMPTSLHVNDSICGAIVIWTGSRNP